MSENKIKIATYIMIAASLVLLMYFFMANLPAINSFLTAVPAVFILSFAAVFLFDAVYFIEFIDSSKTPLDILLDFALMIPFLIIAGIVYSPSLAPAVFALLALIFVVSVLKYWIASKRSHRNDVHLFVRKKARIDIFCVGLYLLFAALTVFFDFTAPYLLLVTSATYLGFMFYGTLTPFFNIKNQ